MAELCQATNTLLKKHSTKTIDENNQVEPDSDECAENKMKAPNDKSAKQYGIGVESCESSLAISDSATLATPKCREKLNWEMSGRDYRFNVSRRPSNVRTRMFGLSSLRITAWNSSGV